MMFFDNANHVEYVKEEKLCIQTDKYNKNKVRELYGVGKRCHLVNSHNVRRTREK